MIHAINKQKPITPVVAPIIMDFFLALAASEIESPSINRLSVGEAVGSVEGA